MKNGFLLTVLIIFLSGCWTTKFVNINDSKTYNSMLRTKFKSIKPLKIHAIRTVRKKREVTYYSIMEYGIGGPEVLCQKEIPIGTVFEVVSVEKCTNCLFLYQYRAKINLLYSSDYVKAPVYIDYFLLEEKEYVELID